MDSGFFYQLSRRCSHARSLRIDIEGDVVFEGLAKLISAQQNLKYLKITNDGSFKYYEKIIPSIIKVSNTLIKLDLELGGFFAPLTLLTELTNLQELVLTLDY